jgi:TolB-like protein
VPENDEQRHSTAESGAGDPGPLSRLLLELADAPGEDLLEAWKKALHPGDRVGRFEIRREVGRGGFGAVYEAFDTELNRVVAVKTLRLARKPKDRSSAWLKKEAEAVARLDHPCIVTLFDVGTCPSGAYLVMELLHGKTLAQRIADGQIPVAEASRIAEEIAKGLAHAHQRGVLHRDLKPANVFLCEDGRVKLLDFGLANLVGSPGQAGAGTPGYMAPEQARGEEVDPRIDVYAAGKVLGEMLGNIHPRKLARAITSATSTDPAGRPRDGQAWLDLLQAAGIARERPARLRHLALLSGLGVLLGGVVAGLAVDLASRPAVAVRGATTPSIAVLPFADLSPARDQAHFSDGVAEEILNAVANVEGLRVPGRTSSFLFKGKDLAEIGRGLHVTHVLEGSVRRSGKRVRISAQVVSVADGYHVWSGTFDRDEAEIFEVQDQVARAVVEALKVRLLPGTAPPSSGTTTAVPEAYEQYLLGRQNVRHYAFEDVRRGISELEKAVALDPGMASAWAELSLSLWWVHRARMEAGPRNAEVRRRAVAAADRAVELAPRSASGYIARSRVRNDLQWDFAGSDADLARAKELAPSGHGVLLAACMNDRARRRYAESAEACRRAIEIDPLSVSARNMLTYTLIAMGDLAGARTMSERVLDISPGSAAGQWNRCHLDILERNRSAALAHCEELKVEFAQLFWRAIMAGEWGSPLEAEQTLADFLARAGVKYPYLVASIYASRDDADRAFQWLDRAYDQHVGLSEVASDPFFRKVESDPRFKELLRRMKLPLD